MWSLAHAIDMARVGGHFADLAGVFDRIDYIDVSKLTFVLPMFAPINAFQQLSLASNFSDSLSQSLTVRMSELRAGVRGMSQSSIITGERMLQPASGNVFGPDPSTQLQSGRDAPQQGESRFGAFVSGFGNLSELGGEAYDGDHFNLASLTTASSANMTVGVDYRVDDHFVIGVASSISRYLAHGDGVTPLDYAGYGATVYAGWWKGHWSLDSYVGVAHQDYAINRVLSPGLVGISADARPGASQMLAGVRAGWSLHPFNGFEIGPRVSLDYQRLSLDKYAEAGGSDLDLQVDGRVVTSLQVQTALEFGYQPVERDGSAGPFAAFGSVALVNELGDGADVVRARFAAAPEFPFVITNGLDRSWTTASLGVAYRPNDSLSLNLQASSDFGRNDALSSTSLQAGFNYTF
jgi:outer membrane autotransporter protein